MGNIVKLVFNAVATGSGFSKMYGEVKGLAAAMPGLTKATMILGQTFGTTGAAVGRMATMLLQGGIWGAAAEGARLLIEKFGLFKDRTEETKEKLDKLAESARKFYETINANSQKSIEKIDKETKRRNEQLDITNRMIKAELQLQKARAISSGDTAGVERIDRQIAEADNATLMSKAVANEQAAAARYRTAVGGLDSARKQVSQIEGEIDALKEKIFYQHWDQVRGNAEASFKAAFGQNARFNDAPLWNDFRKNFRYSDDENNQIKAARERLALAEKHTEELRKSANEARESYNMARENVKALKAEQEAATEDAIAKRMEEGMKAEKERVAAEKKAIDDMAYAEANKKRKLKEKEAQDAKRKLVEQLKAEVDARNKARQDALRKDIEADRKRVAELDARLADARAAVPATIDVLGNAAGMDQAGGLRGERQKDITDRRFNERFTKLLTSGRIKKDANGSWKIDGRASNLDKAVLDRLNANEKVKRAEAQAAKERQRLEKMEGYLKTISENIKTATEI